MACRPVDGGGDDAGEQALWDYVPTAALDRASLSVAISPMPTLLTVLRDALQDGRRGTPQEWRTAVLSRLRARDVEVLAPFVDRSVASYPALLESVDPRAAREPLGSILERIAAAGGDALVHDLEHAQDVSPVPAWERVKVAPDRWLAGYTDALHRCWPAVAPLWDRAQALLEREEDRIHGFMEQGVAPSQALVGLAPRAEIVGDAVQLAPADDASRPLRVDERGVVVLPMVVTSGAGTLSAPNEFLDWIGYPLPESWRAFDDSAPPRASLEALLGGQRATLLRHLDRPRTAGQLARALACAPSVITHHLRALEAAGLVDRRRNGRQVDVHRTARARTLLDLYE